MHGRYASFYVASPTFCTILLPLREEFTLYLFVYKTWSVSLMHYITKETKGMGWWDNTRVDWEGSLSIWTHKYGDSHWKTNDSPYMCADAHGQISPVNIGGVGSWIYLYTVRILNFTWYLIPFLITYGISRHTTLIVKRFIFMSLNLCEVMIFLFPPLSLDISLHRGAVKDICYTRYMAIWSQ